MKLAIGLACIAALVCGCAGPKRPANGPGSGYGAAYIPDVQPKATPAPDYEATVAKCQNWAGSIPYMPSDEHNEALLIVGAAAGIAFGYATPLVGLDLVAAASVGGAGYGGFAYWVQSPERQKWYARQETTMLNCMAQAGYVNNDPSVTVTWQKFDPTVTTIRTTGVDTYNAERLAKSRSCGIAPMANLVSKGPGFEIYRIPCADRGQTMVVRCEFGNCRETGPVLGAVTDRLQVGQK